MTNLISMTDFVLEQFEKLENIPSQIEAVKHINKIHYYAYFLKQPLEIRMFIPCDEDGNVLDEPKSYTLFLNISDEEMSTCGFPYRKECEKYQKAKERVLFEGFFDTTKAPQYSHYISDGMQAVFYMSKNGSGYNNILGMKTIEDLTNKTTIFLTQTALKQIGL